MTATELVTISRPGVVSTLAEVGLMLAETKALVAKLQANMLCGQVAAYAAHHRVCEACGVMQSLKDRRTRRLQTLFGTVEVEAPRFKLCCCRLTESAVAVTVSPVCALLTARCTPELERGQAQLGARGSFRDGARILESLLPASRVNQESLRTRTHAVALQLEATDGQAAAEVSVVQGSGGWAQCPQPRLRSGDADVARASEIQHAVERVDCDRDLGRPALVRVRAQLIADDLLPSVHGGFDPGSPVVARRALPLHAPVPGNVLEMAVPLCRCGLGRVARHSVRARRDDNSRFGMTFGNPGVDAILVIRAVGGERRHGSCDLVQQGIGLRRVVHVLGGQRGSHDPTSFGVHAEMQHAP